MKPVCVPCQRFFKMKRSGFYFTEGMPAGASGGNRPAPGRAEPQMWKPYKVWSGDLWECPGCKATAIFGTGQYPLSIQHMPTFADTVKETNASQFQVNDC